MNDAGPGGVPSGGEPGGRLSRRNLLWLFGGVAGSSFLTTRLWQGVASAGGAEVSPTIPEPSLPAPALTPPDTPTAADVAAGLNWDVDALFRFVADDVRYDPYAGALRGSVGTLWGMAGNSTDQALLLASLLDEAVVPYRFVIGELADSAATDLVAVGGARRRVGQATRSQGLAPTRRRRGVERRGTVDANPRDR